jgi:hypothetical protein
LSLKRTKMRRDSKVCSYAGGGDYRWLEHRACSRPIALRGQGSLLAACKYGSVAHRGREQF